MAQEQLLIAGLGNPGPEYRWTWHNLGYRVVEAAASRFKINFKPGKGEYFAAEKMVSGRRIMLVKPTSFMNLSGRPLLNIVEREDFFHDQLLIICDDVNLPLGRIRLRSGGSDGGQKGLASVIYYLGTEQIPRLRLGIGRETPPGDLRNYVLSEISVKEEEIVIHMIEQAAEAVITYIHDGINAAMNRFNTPTIADKAT
ncbi:MAG: aminoacyl-tRNA hydrolase [FCB group bacterium]|nr:aminoacyl-tRNA hydrolase [FCB group bacterium]